MADTIPLEIRILDMPEFKAFADAVDAEIRKLEEERDEWQERYEELLAECGGVWPR
jgi:hypothetical protein